ncbi:MAG: hypothetical protein IPG17_24505 [Sandaracinaceae bacterium]|nr:hypothetical protein [Sandaracinaceae bacterium]
MHLSPITPTSRAGFTPEVLGRHRLLFHIGRGGMADVFLAAALGPSGFHKEVVIKALRPELAESEDFLEMFMDEARLAARMRPQRGADPRGRARGRRALHGARVLRGADAGPPHAPPRG